VELTSPVTASVDSGLFIITLNRGESGNPLNPDMLSSLADSLTRGFTDSETKVILIRSNRDTFSIGMDLSALLEGSGNTGAEKRVREAVESYSRVLSAIYTGEKPVVCLVSGDVRAGGVGLVCACDVVCATPGATFSLSEVLFGLVPANVLPYLLGLRVSPAKARYLAMTCSEVTGKEAHIMGIVDELAERETMEKLLKNRVRQLMRSSPEAIARVKRLTAEMTWKDLPASREAAVKALTALAGDPAVLDAVQAFKEGMTPSWFARFRPAQKLFLEENE